METTKQRTGWWSVVSGFSRRNSQPRVRKAKGRRIPATRAAEALEDRVLLAVTLTIDYSLDNGFFASQERRNALQAAANEIGGRLNDSLGAVATRAMTVVDPTSYSNGTFTRTTTQTFGLGASELRIFVGGAAMGGNQVGVGGWRWNSGIRSFDLNNDFAPYVGHVAFDNDGSTSWNFNDAAGSGETNFRAIARHELLHVLGLGGANSWDVRISGGTFTGANARAANGGANPAVTADGGHFAQGVNSLMTPIISSITSPTGIDWGALDDIGWDVAAPPPPPPPPITVPLEPTGLRTFDALGVFRDGIWTLDANMSNSFDAGDTTFIYGQPGDLPVVGDWNGDGLTEVGIFRNGRWSIDVNGNRQFDVADVVFNYGQAGDLPIVGDWNGDGGDEIGVFRDGHWFLDSDRSFSFSASDAVFRFGLPGDIPVAADFFNQGVPVWGVYRDGAWSIDRNRNGRWDGVAASVDFAFSLGGASDLPVTGNWLGPDPSRRTNDEQAGVYRGGTWLLDLNEDFSYGGGDRPYGFGVASDRPVRGAWAVLTLQGPSPLPQRSEIAVFRDGVWTLDANGNGVFDRAFDTAFSFGIADDLSAAGDWDGNRLSEVGVFRNGWWYLDINGSMSFDASDIYFKFGEAGDQPIVGDWNGDGRDDVGVFRNGTWYLDMNGNRVLDAGDVTASFGGAGDIAVIGDWNGDGRDDIGVMRGNTWYLDSDGSRSFNSGDAVFAYGLSGDRPVAGDWDGDGRDEIGVFRNGTWYLDRDRDRSFDDLDWVFSYGLAGDLVSLGAWRLPTAS